MHHCNFDRRHVARSTSRYRDCISHGVAHVQKLHCQTTATTTHAAAGDSPGSERATFVTAHAAKVSSRR